jgi:hypothetical protein
MGLLRTIRSGYYDREGLPIIAEGTHGFHERCRSILFGRSITRISSPGLVIAILSSLMIEVRHCKSLHVKSGRIINHRNENSFYA